MKTQTTRRTILAGLAVAPVAGLPAIAGAVSDLPLSEELAAAFARHRAAQAAYDACDEDDDESSNRLFVEEFDARDNLAETPCTSDSELHAKLKYLLDLESRMEGRRPDNRDDFGSVLVAIDIHFNGEAQS
jgi:hypothetical protein